MSTTHPYHVSQADKAAFENDGAVCLRGMLGEEELERLREIIDRNLEHTNEIYARTRPAEWYFHHIYVWQYDPELAKFCFDSALPQAASQLLDSDKLNLIHDQIFVKTRPDDERTDWHNDQPYWPVQGSAMSIWLAVDEVTDQTGTLEFVRGSHRWGRWFSRIGKILPGDTVNSDFERPYDTHSEGDDHEILSWDLAPGDAVAFSGLVVHGAHEYRSHVRRRAYAARYAGKDATYSDAVGAAPHYCNPELSEGQALDSDKYPVVFGA